MTKQVLWITPKWTYPAIDGARVASEKLISEITQFDIKLDYISLSHPEDKVKPDEIIQAYNLNSAQSLTRDLPLSLISKICYYLIALVKHPFTPLTLSTFNKQLFKKQINEQISQHAYDAIVLDGLHLGVCLDKNYFKKYKIYLRAHNVESDIWKRAAIETGNPFKKLFLNWQYRLMLKFEKAILAKVNQVFAISYEDQEELKKLAPTANISTILLGMDFTYELPKTKAEKIQLLFLGRLDWPPNKDGLKWFLDEVWPKLDHTRLHLNIAGSGQKDWLVNYQHDQNITLHGFVDDIKDLYAASDICLIPIFYGSGTRIKVVEAVSYKRAMIATELGVMGAGLRGDMDYIQAQSAKEWIEVLNNLKLEELGAMSERAFIRIKDTYDQRVIAQKLYNLL
jgi:glycosyltransferase involved in cell wall biosynthesis